MEIIDISEIPPVPESTVKEPQVLVQFIDKNGLLQSAIFLKSRWSAANKENLLTEWLKQSK